MRIAIIVSSLRKAGPVIVAADQIKLLTEKGHSCELFYFDDCQDKMEFTCKTKKISLKTDLDFSKYDVVHCHTGRPCLYVLLRKPFFTNTLFVTTFHNYVFQDFHYHYGRLKGFIAALLYLMLALRFDKIITLSNDAKKYYKRFLFFKHLDFMYNSVNTAIKPLPSAEMSELLNFKGESKLLGINAQLNMRKGQDLIISVLPQLPDCKLWLLGTGKDENSYRALARKYNVQDRVFFPGFRKNAVDYLPHYDVFLFPSHSEGCPLALLEAAATNKKIVCSNIPVHEEMFSNTEVILFDINDPQSIVSAVQKALVAPVEQPQLQKHFQETFAAETICNHLTEIYNFRQ